MPYVDPVEPIGPVAPVARERGSSVPVQESERDETEPATARMRRVDKAAAQALRLLVALFSDSQFFTQWVKASAENMRRQIAADRDLNDLQSVWDRLKDALQDELKRQEILRHDMAAPPKLTYGRVEEVPPQGALQPEKLRICQLTIEPGTTEEHVASLLSRILYPVVEPQGVANLSDEDLPDYRSLVAKWVKLRRR